MIVLNLHLRTADQRQPSGVAHALTLCVIPKQISVTIEIPREFILIASLSSGGFLIIGIGLTLCMFSCIHRMIRPLRILIAKMKEIMSSNNPDSSSGGELNDEASSEEIQALYKVFHDLIQDRLFSENAFLRRPSSEDVISIMDLAKTCLMYQSEKNIKAAGVCYNNIANLHFKNGKFLIASKTYLEAIKQSNYKINQIRLINKDTSQYKEVLAHRSYQLAIANYKYVRHELDDIRKKNQLKFSNIKNNQNLSSEEDENDDGMKIGKSWKSVDKRIQDALNLYYKIKIGKNGQPKYIDLIIRLLIVRAYAYIQIEKSIKASNVLEEVGQMLKKIEKN